jgi:hypothetical protein
MLWAWSDHASRQGTEWEVAVRGYDPRDFLRGHYVEFSYDWPLEGTGEEPGTPVSAPRALCLYGDPPHIDHAAAFDPSDRAALQACAHPLLADPGGVYGSGSLARGRLYVGQDRAQEIEEQLARRDLRGIVRFRQRADGVMTVQDIRFSPLTPDDRGEGDTTETEARPTMGNPAANE